MGAMGFGIASGALSALGALGNAETNRLNSRHQAAIMENNAANIRAQGQAEANKANIEADAIERRKSQIRRQYREIQGHNRSMLAAGNVAMDSGSALDTQTGNINAYAADLGENAYEKAIRLWQADNNKRAAENEARNMEAQASYIKNTAGTIGTSLLTTAMGGAQGFAQGYALAGGRLSQLFGG